MSGLSRRSFVQAGAAAGGGLLLNINLPFAKAEAQVCFTPMSGHQATGL
jgi:hypothetical protein